MEGAVKCVKKATDLIEADHPHVGVDYVAITATTIEDIDVNFAKLEDRDRVGSFKISHYREAFAVPAKEARKDHHVLSNCI